MKWAIIQAFFHLASRLPLIFQGSVRSVYGHVSWMLFVSEASKPLTENIKCCAKMDFISEQFRRELVCHHRRSWSRPKYQPFGYANERSMSRARVVTRSPWSCYPVYQLSLGILLYDTEVVFKPGATNNDTTFDFPLPFELMACPTYNVDDDDVTSLILVSSIFVQHSRKMICWVLH